MGIYWKYNGNILEIYLSWPALQQVGNSSHGNWQSQLKSMGNRSLCIAFHCFAPSKVEIHRRTVSWALPLKSISVWFHSVHQSSKRCTLCNTKSPYMQFRRCETNFEDSRNKKLISKIHEIRNSIFRQIKIGHKL